MSSNQHIFVTGVTGYIGGHTVTRLLEKYLELEANITLLVRDENQKKLVTDRWPKIGIAIGTLDDTELLKSEAAKHEIVLLVALTDGLSMHKPSPGYFIHVSRTGILNDASNGFRNPANKIYHDIADVEEITSFPFEGHWHRDVDAAVLAENSSSGVSTTIVCPPTVHGIGRGPGKTRSVQIPWLIESILKRGGAFQVLEGQNIWDCKFSRDMANPCLHIFQIFISDDLANDFIVLIGEALKYNGGDAQWGTNGYYIVEAGEFKWGDAISAVSQAMFSNGAIQENKVDKLSVAEASEFHPWAPSLWGGNCRSYADRLRTLGWKPFNTSIMDSVPLTVADELKI